MVSIIREDIPEIVPDNMIPEGWERRQPEHRNDLYGYNGDFPSVAIMNFMGKLRVEIYESDGVTIIGRTDKITEAADLAIQTMEEYEE